MCKIKSGASRRSVDMDSGRQPVKSSLDVAEQTHAAIQLISRPVDCCLKFWQATRLLVNIGKGREINDWI